MIETGNRDIWFRKFKFFCFINKMIQWLRATGQYLCLINYDKKAGMEDLKGQNITAKLKTKKKYTSNGKRLSQNYNACNIDRILLKDEQIKN